MSRILILVLSLVFCTGAQAEYSKDFDLDKLEMPQAEYDQCLADQPDLAGLYIAFFGFERGNMVYSLSDFFCPFARTADKYRIATIPNTNRIEIDFWIKGIPNQHYELIHLQDGAYTLHKIGGRYTRTDTTIMYHNHLIEFRNLLVDMWTREQE